MKEILLTQGKVALIDDGDFELVSKYKWCAKKHKNTFYACTNIKKRTVLLHRLIMGATEIQEIDHRDGNGLDNRRANLRFATRAQNVANTRMKSTNKSGYKGVCWDTERAKWMAYISHAGKGFYLGRYDDKRLAAKAYDAKAKELFGEFAKTNF